MIAEIRDLLTKTRMSYFTFRFIHGWTLASNDAQYYGMDDNDLRETVSKLTEPVETVMMPVPVELVKARVAGVACNARSSDVFLQNCKDVLNKGREDVATTQNT